MPNLESDRKKAERKFNRFLAKLPDDLVQQEASLMEQFRRRKATPLELLAELYQFLDLFRPYLSMVTPCKKRCSFCCSIPVSVSALEIQYMVQQDPDLLQKCGRVSPDTDTPCPFLRRGECSVYSVRPYACRKHVTFTDTAYWCHPTRCNSVVLPLLSFSEADAVYASLIQVSGSTVMDIRAAAEAVKGGGLPLAAKP